MQLELLKSKIHRATVTDANLNYEGSITVARDLMDAAHILTDTADDIRHDLFGNIVLAHIAVGRTDDGLLRGLLPVTRSKVLQDLHGLHEVAGELFLQLEVIAEAHNFRR